MAIQQKVSAPVIKRLPKYYRYIRDLRENGVTKISSSELAKAMGTTASQVRQDFNCFGGFGQQGIGYTIDVLYAELTKLLFSEDKIRVVLIGTGSLGQTISRWITHETQGYQLLAAFDANPDVIGKEVSGTKILDVKELTAYCTAHKPDMAVICIPKEPARKLAPTLVGLGIKSFWNFSHYDLSVNNPDIIVENVHLGDSLMSLGYMLRNE